MAYGGQMATEIDTETDVTSGAAPSRGRGRPRAFDEDEVLDKLLTLFWERGFEASSLSEMVEAAGLNKSSLYNTFGSKEEVFARVLERYMDFRRNMIKETMSGELGFEEIGIFLDMQRQEIAGPTGFMGCLAINAQTELGLRDEKVAEMAGQYRSMLADGLRPALDRASADGVIDGSMIDTYIHTLTACTMALSVSARSGSTTDELLEQIESTRRLTESWRKP